MAYNVYFEDVEIGQVKGLKSIGATMPPQCVLFAYTGSQYRRGGGSGQ